MDLFEKELAPITDEAWGEIETVAVQAIKNSLTARQFLDVQGPMGVDFAAVAEGRLDLPEMQREDGIYYGIRRVLPLVEVRVPFWLNAWELDNLHRGAKDVDLQPVVEAARKAAHFEDRIVYGGFEKGNISGLERQLKLERLDLGSDSSSTLEAVTRATILMQENSVEGPYLLVAGKKLWTRLNTFVGGYPLKQQVESVVGGSVIYSPVVDSAYLVSKRGGDFEMTLGMDFSLGYEGQDEKGVRLYITESLTFRVLEPHGGVTFRI